LIEANETTNLSGPPEQGERGAYAPHERTCVGCGERSAPGEMVRLVIAPNRAMGLRDAQARPAPQTLTGEIAVDAAGGGFGRGAHVHARGSCISQAAARGLMRATKGQAKTVSIAVKEAGEVVTSGARPIDAKALASAIEAAMHRRIEGLLGAAVRARRARIGAGSATGAWRAGEAALIVVATDAAATADLTAVREAVSSGAAVGWGTKAQLGALFHRERADHDEGVAVVTITDARIAQAVREAVQRALGARSVGGSAIRDNDGGRRRPQRGVEDPATRAAIRGKVGAERAGRFGRQTRRETSGVLSGKRRAAIVPAQGKQAVERSE